MSVSNDNTYGNKKNNMPFQLAMLQLLGQISNNTLGSNQDYELITYNYRAIAAGPGYAINDFITRTQIVFVPTGNLISTLWFNQTTGVAIVAPLITNLVAVAPPSAVTVNNLPTVLGQALMINSLAVTIASDQSAIPVTNPNLDVLLSTRNAEATQLLVKTAVDAINTKLTSTVRTPSLVRATGAGTVAAGARAVSVYNAGNANGTWLGVTIKQGEQLSYDAGAQGDTLSAFAYDGTGTELVITSIV